MQPTIVDALRGIAQVLHIACRCRYGSYGCCMDPYFSALRLPLLDRGVVYVIANVRGGSEMGRSWFVAGASHVSHAQLLHSSAVFPVWMSLIL